MYHRDSTKQSRITEQAYNPVLKMNNNQWKPGVSHYTYDVNGHVLGAIDEIGLKSFNYISNAQGQVKLRYAEDRTVGDDKNDHVDQLAKPSHASNR